MLPFEHRELLIQGRRSGMVVLSTIGPLYDSILNSFCCMQCCTVRQFFPIFFIFDCQILRNCGLAQRTPRFSRTRLYLWPLHKVFSTVLVSKSYYRFTAVFVCFAFHFICNRLEMTCLCRWQTCSSGYIRRTVAVATYPRHHAGNIGQPVSVCCCFSDGFFRLFCTVNHAVKDFSHIRSSSV
jgi:hypothetical protein